MCTQESLNIRDGSSISGPKQYLSKIPPHLHGLAMRNVPFEEKCYTQSSDPQHHTADGIQSELDADDENEDILVYLKQDFDQTQSELVLDGISSDVLKHFDGDMDDALLLRDLRGKMNPSDFAKIFSSRVGDLL
jgi:hypothetical protein